MSHTLGQWDHTLIVNSALLQYTIHGCILHLPNRKLKVVAVFFFTNSPHNSIICHSHSYTSRFENSWNLKILESRGTSMRFRWKMRAFWKSEVFTEVGQNAHGTSVRWANGKKDQPQRQKSFPTGNRKHGNPRFAVVILQIVRHGTVKLSCIHWRQCLTMSSMQYLSEMCINASSLNESKATFRDQTIKECQRQTTLSQPSRSLGLHGKCSNRRIGSFPRRPVTTITHRNTRQILKSGEKQERTITWMTASEFRQRYFPRET